MLLDRVSNPGPLTYESGALPIALRGPARQIVDMLVVINREHLPTIRSFHEYLSHFYCDATNIEDIFTIMNWNLQDPRPSTV